MLHYDLVKISDEVDGLFAAAAGMRSKVQIQYFVMNIWLRLESQLKSLSDNMFQTLQHDGLPSPDMMLKYETLHDIRSWLRYRPVQRRRNHPEQKAEKKRQAGRRDDPLRPGTAA
ncbi:hypothetical protein VQ056_31085 [Paenibacillus sp. JTLBN-2024]